MEKALAGSDMVFVTVRAPQRAGQGEGAVGRRGEGRRELENGGWGRTMSEPWG